MIEVDGSQHQEAEGMARDLDRTRYLEASGLRVLRFTNLEALLETDAVMFVTLEALEHPHPDPLPRGEGS